jgi:hypothetical protein
MLPGDRLRVVGRTEHLEVHLPAWARTHGHSAFGDVIVRGSAPDKRWAGAVRAGGPSTPVDQPPRSWGLAARGSLVEAGGPPLDVADLDDRGEVWTDLAPKLYAQAAANQWDPATAIDWSPPDLPVDVEDAVIQVMTYMVENEQAALAVPARFVWRIHPHFREIIQFLATQIADEARHVEVFVRRASLAGRPLGISGVGGRASLATLVNETDWTTASFLLSVLGEGTFLSLLAFLERFAPDPVTARIARLTLQDEARHVAFAMGHLREMVVDDPRTRDRIRAAIERRHDTLATTSGLAQPVHDALVVLAAGAWTAHAIAAGWASVRALEEEMDTGRRRRLVRLGFSEAEAAELSQLHTRNFM